ECSPTNINLLCARPVATFSWFVTFSALISHTLPTTFLHNRRESLFLLLTFSLPYQPSLQSRLLPSQQNENVMPSVLFVYHQLLMLCKLLNFALNLLLQLLALILLQRIYLIIYTLLLPLGDLYYHHPQYLKTLVITILLLNFLLHL